MRTLAAALGGGIAAIAIGLAPAPVAGADANDREFLKATDRVIMMHTGSDPDGHWVGYPKVRVQLRINTAHTVCDMLDDNATAQDIQDFIVTALDDRREHATYLAAWFEQMAVDSYCTWHSDEMGTI
jgi:hypothetical protein